ncbi:MAG TPA: fumarylacetoacetate hydrolase family protein [Stellaceae bacterium]|nr:fumarylacetoacetate hydrolase family protein [Stellaceae bacterium]
MSKTAEIARRILDAYASGTTIAPVRGEITGVAEAYAVQRATIEVWLGQGRKLIGHKIGLTSPAVQAQLGVGEPDFGALFADMVVPDGAVVPKGRVLQPRIEGEIAFVLKSDLRGDRDGRISPADVIAATDYVVPAIEICGSRIANWDIRIEDTIADDASSGLIVLSGQRSKPSLDALATIAMAVRPSDAEAVSGSGDACLGNPANAVAWLGEALLRFGGRLRAGDVVMSGALAKMLPAAPGTSFTADFGAFGSVSVGFAP